MTSSIKLADFAEWMNKQCHCVGLDKAQLHTSLNSTFQDKTLYQWIEETRPNLFSSTMVYLARRHVDTMVNIVDAIHRIAANAHYQQHVLSWAPDIARPPQQNSGVFFGFDFHLGEDGPKIIEINTNAGGAMLNSILAKAQRACCAEVENLNTLPIDLAALDDGFVAMFKNEWRLAWPTFELKAIAIVDRDPTNQFLYPEFVLFQQLFEQHGVRCFILDPSELHFTGEGLCYNNNRIDLVYNRLTDFYLIDPENSALRQAYENRSVVVTPHPNSYALLADKRNLTALCDADLLRKWHVEERDISIITQGVATTHLVTKENIDDLWQERKHYFFKPATGFASKAVYRGDKITRRVWGEIAQQDYVAQRLVLPSERDVIVSGEAVPLKFDVRCYVYEGKIQLIAARLYQGQTTNFRTQGGGFAPIFYLP